MYRHLDNHKDCSVVSYAGRVTSSELNVLVEKRYFIREDKNWSLSHSAIDVASKSKKMPYFVLYRGNPIRPLSAVGFKNEELTSKVVKAIEGYLLDASVIDFKDSDQMSDFQKVTLDFRSYNLQIFEPCDNLILVLAAKNGLYSKRCLESSPIDASGGGENFWRVLYDLKSDRVVFFSINQPF